MAMFGGYCPFPLRFGGSKPRVQTITEALNAGRGTAYDVSTDSPVWAEDNATARAISSVWDYNELLGNQFVPLKLSVLLSRWEKILGLSVSPSDTLTSRRAKIQAILSRAGVTPAYQEVVDRLNVLVSPVTFSLVHNAPADAGVISSWPGGWYVSSLGTTPPAVSITGRPNDDYDVRLDIVTGGARGTATFQWSSDNGASYSTAQVTAATVVLGTTGLTVAFPVGTYNSDNFYFSNTRTFGFASAVVDVTILAEKPSWMSEAEYYDHIQSAFPFMDDFLPAWVGYHTIRDGSSPGHFILDDPHNLDNERFSP